MHLADVFLHQAMVTEMQICVNALSPWIHCFLCMN